MGENRSDDIVPTERLSAPIHVPLWRKGHSPVGASADGTFRQRDKRADR